MMNGYGAGWAWMMVMALVWFAVIAAIVWVAVRFMGRPGDRTPGHPRETPQEILDRRFAQGEIDADAYTEARDRLAGREPR